jgi:uncharacterized membrane protein YwzB
MSIACSFFGGSSGNPACATWWIIETRHVHLVDAKHVMRYLRVCCIMVFVILEIMTSNCMVILLQIGLEVIQTEITL